MACLAPLCIWPLGEATWGASATRPCSLALVRGGLGCAGAAMAGRRRGEQAGRALPGRGTALCHGRGPGGLIPRSPPAGRGSRQFWPFQPGECPGGRGQAIPAARPGLRPASVPAGRARDALPPTPLAASGMPAVVAAGRARISAASCRMTWPDASARQSWPCLGNAPAQSCCRLKTHGLSGDIPALP